MKLTSVAENIAMAAGSLPHFDNFNVHAEEHTAGTRWKKYLARFEMLIQALNLQDKPSRKKALLIHYAGEEVFDIFNTFTAEQKGGEDENGYGTLKKSLTDHFEPKRNLDFETFKFRQAKQDPGETVDAFCTRLRLLASTCEFADTQRELKAQILQGCSSHRLRRRALREDMTLEKLLEIARSLEISDIQANAMEHNSETQSVHFVRGGRKAGNSKFSGTSVKQRDKPVSGQTCGWCGYEKNHTRDQCPAKDKECKFCHKNGHFQSVCRGRSRQQPRSSTQQSRSKPSQSTQQRRVLKVNAPDSDSDSEDCYVFGVGP